MTTIDRSCEWCKKPFTARSADVKRGWARFCSKSCKAMKQEKQTAQHATFQAGIGEHNKNHPEWLRREIQFEQDMDGATSSHGQDGTGGF